MSDDKLHVLRVHVPTRILTTLIQILEGEGAVVEFEGSVQERPRRMQRRRAVDSDASHNKRPVSYRSNTCAGILLRKIGTEQASIKNLTTALVSAGYSDSSVSPALSNLFYDGVALETNPGIWALTPKGLQEYKVQSLMDQRALA